MKVCAVVYLPREGGSPSLMLRDILFDPAARWLAAALERAGVERFEVVCHPDDRPAARLCFPSGTMFYDWGARPDETGKAVIDRPLFLDDEGAKALCGAPGPGGVNYPLDDCLPAWNTVQMMAKQASVRRLQDGLSADPVRFIDPEQVYIGPDVTVGAGTLLLPGTILRGRTAIGRNCVIGPNAMIRDCVIGDRVEVNASQLNESSVDDDAAVGPFAYVRPGCRVGRGVKVGDFVELKNSTVGDGAKISHLTYVGDTDAGARVNFGCGTVTVNYDGKKKHRTTIGDGAFIGCNTNLVAPVTVGEGAYTAAGSTVTEDVPPDALAIARERQTVKKDWVKRRGKD